jgi:hypothetical protein
MTAWAPIGVFIYRRPDHARRTISSLLACEGSDRSPIHVFADGPRNTAEADAVARTRAVAHVLLGDRAVYVEQKANRGLAASIIAGTTELCDRYGQAIIVEDDLVLAPSFLRFLNDGLERYRDDQRVMQVSGHIFDVPGFEGRTDALLLPMTTSWGWATWGRAWTLFDPEVTGWQTMLADKATAHRFNLRGHYDYLRMLDRQQRGEVDSWAVRWHYSVFVHGGLSLFPPCSLVRNVGFDGSGTHGRWSVPVSQGAAPPGMVQYRLPDDISASPETDLVFAAIDRAWRTTAPRKILGALRRLSRRHHRP